MSSPRKKPAPSKSSAKRKPKHALPVPPAGSRVIPPAATAGRARKARPPRTEHQAKLAEAIEEAEDRRDVAAAAYSRATTVAVEIDLLHAEVEVSLAWSAFCRAQGIHSPARGYGELAVKFAARLVALREIAATDKLDELLKRTRQEDALANQKETP